MIRNLFKGWLLYKGTQFLTKKMHRSSSRPRFNRTTIQTPHDD